MAQNSKLKDLPQLPPIPTVTSMLSEKTKNITKTRSNPESQSSKTIVKDLQSSANSEKATQINAKPFQPPSTAAATRTKSVDRLITILEDSPINDMQKYVGMVVSAIERMDARNPATVVPQTEMVVRMYNYLDRARRDRLKANPGGMHVSREELRWEREIERRLRLL